MWQSVIESGRQIANTSPTTDSEYEMDSSNPKTLHFSVINLQLITGWVIVVLSAVVSAKKWSS
jgi:hypothetical protein